MAGKTVTPSCVNTQINPQLPRVSSSRSNAAVLTVQHLPSFSSWLCSLHHWQCQVGLQGEREALHCGLPSVPYELAQVLH